MASIVARCGGLSPYLSAARQTVPSHAQPLLPAVALKAQNYVNPQPDVLTSQSMATLTAKTVRGSATSGGFALPAVGGKFFHSIFA